MRNDQKVQDQSRGIIEVRFYYLRSPGNRDGTATVCVVKAHRPESRFSVYYVRGVSFCEPGDQFSKRDGRNRALGRAVQALERSSDSGRIPIDPREARARLFLTTPEFCSLSGYDVTLTPFEQRLFSVKDQERGTTE